MPASRKPLCIPICHSLTDNWTNKKGGKKSRLKFCLSAANSTANLFLRGWTRTSSYAPFKKFPLGPRTLQKTTKKAVSLLQLTACFRCGAPEEIRTPGLQVRSLLLYPAELRARREKLCIAIALPCQTFLRKKSIFMQPLLSAVPLSMGPHGRPSPFPHTFCRHRDTA